MRSKAGWVTSLGATAILVANPVAAMELTGDCDGGKLTDASRLVANASTAWLGEVSSVRAGRTDGGGGALMVTVNGSFRVRLTRPLKGAAPEQVKARWFMTWTDDGQILGYRPDKGERYLVWGGPSGAFLDRVACLSGVPDLAPSSP
jgi:hypothetical protein